MKKIPVIIDCDTGNDDAIALVLAFASKELDVRAVTVSGGNQTLAKTLRNTKRVLFALGKHPPVAPGADKPLFRKLEVAADVHGEDGLAGAALQDPPWEEEPVAAWDLMRIVITESPEPVTLIPTGPLTNIAILFRAYPEVKKNIARVSLMGGSIFEGGNRSAAAEFNILVDPEAADIVFKSGVPITMCPLDVTHKALILPEETETLRRHGSKISLMTAGIIDFYFKYYSAQGFAGAPMHDACAVAVTAAPEIFTSRELPILIETRGNETTGMTLADMRRRSGAVPNANVCFNVDRPAFIRMIIDACESYKD